MKALLFIIFLSFSGMAYTWNSKGHILISEMAYHELTPDTQQLLGGLSHILFKQLPKQTQKRLKHLYPGVSTFALLSTLPDTFKDDSLQALFRRFHALLPDSLKRFKNESTKAWHFVNLPYPYHHCQQVESKNVVWAIHTLLPLIKNEKHPASKALMLILLTHFIEDIHQPLHTFSKTNFRCQNDYGGNAFCLVYSKKRPCKHNLHRLWDSAVGYLSSHESFKKKRIQLTHRFPRSLFQNALILKRPLEWAKENQMYASFIYSPSQYRRPRQGYYQKAQLIAQKQIALAAYRLSKVLNEMGKTPRVNVKNYSNEGVKALR